MRNEEEEEKDRMSEKGSSQRPKDNDRHEDKRKNEEEEEGRDETKRPKKTPTVAEKKTPISMKLGSFQKAKESASKAKTVATGGLVANVFGADDDDEEEEEEMPPEARMRMRNMGRDTPTSTGPNSFGKTRQGFCDSRKGLEKMEKKTTNVVLRRGHK